jgi:sugar lactone lactonase YvrE
VWAGGIGPDGITLDADGAIWTHSADTRTHTGKDDAPEGEVIRIREGGEILDRIALDRAGFACALGGPDGRHLFMGAADWRGTDQIEAALAARTGQVLVTDAPAPHAGRP